MDDGKSDSIGDIASGDGPNDTGKTEGATSSKETSNTLDDDDVVMAEAENPLAADQSELPSIPPTDHSSETTKDNNSEARQNGDIQSTSTSTKLTQTEQLVTPSTSTNNKTTGAVRRPAGSKPRTNRFAKRNYRTQILNTSSSSSNRSTPDRESTETSNQANEDGEQRTNRDEGNARPIWELDDDNEDDDDDEEADNESSDCSFNLSDMGESDSADSVPTKTSCDADKIKDEIMMTPKPNYNGNLLLEVIKREHGLSYQGLTSMRGRTPLSFQERIYGARQTIERLKLLHTLEEHDGCVNSLNFNKSGNLLASGSDDLKIILWDWASKKVKFSIDSGHTANVFQTKFIEFGSGGSDLNIVSSARDGRVRYATISPDGTYNARSRVLFKHSGAVHKVSPSPHTPYEVLTAGEDGNVFRCDLRDNHTAKVCTVKTKIRKVPLYSIAHSPHAPHFCVCGRDQYVRVYDKRNTKEPLYKMFPEHLKNKKGITSHITCAVYNNSGSEILASYSDEHIYSFSTNLYVDGKHLHRYRGHTNNKTIKGVNYFGLNSEYVVSGSDCGNFFIWDTESEAILNWKKADYAGVVNCLEPHPSFPILATSGIDHDVKIWAPISDKYPPVMEGLEKCLKNNTRSMPGSTLFDDRALYFFVRQCLRTRERGLRGADGPSLMPDISTSDTSTDDDDNDCDSDDDNLHVQSFQSCNPQ